MHGSGLAAVVADHVEQVINVILLHPITDVSAGDVSNRDPASARRTRDEFRAFVVVNELAGAFVDVYDDNDDDDECVAEL